MVKLSFCLRRRNSPKHEQVKEEYMSVALSDLDEHDKAVARQALTAVAAGSVLNVEYDGLTRLVEVHAVGLSTKGRPVMRVYQLDAGQSHSGNPSPWRLMSLDKVFRMPEIVDIKSLAPREGYRKGDLGMSHIFTEV